MKLAASRYHSLMMLTTNSLEQGKQTDLGNSTKYGSKEVPSEQVATLKGSSTHT